VRYENILKSSRIFSGENWASDACKLHEEGGAGQGRAVQNVCWTNGDPLMSRVPSPVQLAFDLQTESHACLRSCAQLTTSCHACVLRATCAYGCVTITSEMLSSSCA
jgi:hypothetical protein